MGIFKDIKHINQMVDLLTKLVSVTNDQINNIAWSSLSIQQAFDSGQKFIWKTKNGFWLSAATIEGNYHVFQSIEEKDAVALTALEVANSDFDLAKLTWQDVEEKD